MGPRQLWTVSQKLIALWWVGATPATSKPPTSSQESWNQKNRPTYMALVRCFCVPQKRYGITFCLNETKKLTAAMKSTRVFCIKAPRRLSMIQGLPFSRSQEKIPRLSDSKREETRWQHILIDQSYRDKQALEMAFGNVLWMVSRRLGMFSSCVILIVMTT